MPETLTAQDIKDGLRDLWRGGLPLPQVFWTCFFAPVFVLQLAGALFFEPLFAVLSLAWTAFMAKPLIDAADEYSGDPLWALLSKGAAAVLALCIFARLVL